MRCGGCRQAAHRHKGALIHIFTQSKSSLNFQFLECDYCFLLHSNFNVKDVTFKKMHFIATLISVNLAVKL